MKVTAILPDDLIQEVRELAGESTITASLITALREWADLQHIKALNRKVAKKPLELRGASAALVRQTNRRRG